MKTTLKALAEKYRVSYKSLRDIVSGLGTEVIELGKRGCTVHNMEALEAAIAHLPRRESMAAIVPIEVSDDEVIEAEVISDEVSSDISDLQKSVVDNSLRLRELAELAATEYGRQIANAYRQTLAKEVSTGVDKAHRDILGLLGK